MHDVAPDTNKALGQHWLMDLPALQAMCEAADLTATDHVLEIGPGLGTLTDLLVKQSAKVVAVEFDPALAKGLPYRIKAGNLRVVHADILRFNFEALPGPYKIVANIPYYLTSNLIRVLSESAHPPLIAALLVQKEVAERIAAGPGDMSILSVTAQFYWEVSLGRIVAASLFTPPPKVNSQILILRRRPTPLFSSCLPKAYFRIVKAGFAQRRKTLLNSLSAGLQMTRPEVEQALARASIMPSARAQSLSLEQWYALYESLTC